MKSHNEFMEEVEEATREPTLAEKTKDALNVVSEAENGSN